jgi:hypothetical protein
VAVVVDGDVTIYGAGKKATVKATASSDHQKVDNTTRAVVVSTKPAATYGTSDSHKG